MTTRIDRDPSPIRAGFVHGALGIVTLCGVFGMGGGALHIFGDADAAGPELKMALFEPVNETDPDLKTRLAEDPVGAVTMAAASTRIPAQNSAAEPDLGVEYISASATPASAAREDKPSGAQGVRINGRIVMPGQSLSALNTKKPATPTRTDDIIQASATLADEAPMQTAAGPKTIFDTNSRSFQNAENKPTVSIVVGGLGINARHTVAAINELPPEITLSFAPTAKNLSSYIRQARKAGHEVLIEVPMEPYDYGRDRPHPNILQVSAGDSVNVGRLDKLLSRVSGYAGVTNYRGGKFATEPDAAQPVFDRLAERGLAFFEDGSLTRSVFADTAEAANLPFARASTVLDARPDGEEIEMQLLLLEANAKEHGRALGSGFAYPITIDMLKDWASRLEGKGLVLAPASYYAKQSMDDGQVKLAALDSAG